MDEIETTQLELPVIESKTGTYQVIKSNKLIESQYLLTANQQKLLSACISQVDPTNDYDKKNINPCFSFTFTRTDITRLTKIQSRHLSEFLEGASVAFSKLQAHQIDTSSGEKKFKIMNLLDEATYDGSKFCITFTRSASRELYDLSKVGYTKYLLENIESLTNKYAIRLYELIQKVMSPRVNQQLCNFNVDDLYFYLGLRDYDGQEIVSGYTDKFSNFRRRVLVPVIKQINSKTDLTIEIHAEKRVGRRIQKLTFMVQRSVSSLGVKTADPDMVKSLSDIGVTIDLAREWFETYGESHLARNIALMNDQKGTGKNIRNPGAYLHHLVKYDIANLPPVANPYSFLYSGDKSAQEFVKLLIMPKWNQLSDEWQKDLLNFGIQAGQSGQFYSRWKNEYIINSVNSVELENITKELNAEALKKTEAALS